MRANKAKIDVMVMQENDASSWLDAGAQGAYRGGMLPEAWYRVGVYLSRKYTEPGGFIALPGWEWSHRNRRQAPEPSNRHFCRR